jgi:hypothetical protein
MHDDLPAILGFHDGFFLHASRTAVLVFHGHFPVLEDIDRRAIFQLDDLFAAARASSEANAPVVPMTLSATTTNIFFSISLSFRLCAGDPALV